MNAARPSDGLLGAEQTVKLLQHVDGCCEGVPLGQLLLDIAALSSTSQSKILNTISMLDNLSFLQIAHATNSRAVSSKTSSDDIFAKIRHETAQSFANRITLSERESCIRASADGSGVELDSFLLPGVIDGFRLWLIEFDIAFRSTAQGRYWTVRSDVTNYFLKCVSHKNERPRPKRITLSTLKTQLDRNEELGREAEEWVLDFEKRRLTRHMLVDQIRRISDDDVSAGYDIVSFSGLKNLTFDRFIEVKSYSMQPHFFWSRNEINVAMEMAENYILILVDRTKMNNQDYFPTEIPDPYRALMQTDENGWEFEPNSFEFSKI